MTSSHLTIADVARLAGVSIATVSRVLNGTAPVDKETAARVRSAVEALNYFPHSAARTLASHRTDTIGLLLPEIIGPFFQPLLRGVEAGVSEAGYDLLIHATQSRPGNATRRPLGEHNTDGLLVFTESLDERELARLHGIGFPVVLLHQAPPISLNFPIVTIENQSGAQMIVEHLIKTHNCRKIVFMQGPVGHEDSTWREKGYCMALKAFGIQADPRLIARGNFDRNDARASMERLIAQGVEFDAVFTGDDESAIGVLNALRQAGKKVPEEIAVVGFDDSIFANTLLPPLTTVRAPTEEVGSKAVRQLVRVIQGEAVEPRLVLSTELKLRQSCGCPV
jgi:LacI family transcriptional regulator